jgi:hypothetical protein
MRIWAKAISDKYPNLKFAMKVSSVAVEGIIIGLLVYTLIMNSCQICYQTGVGVQTYKQCKNVADVMETGMPKEIIDNVYNTPEQTRLAIYENSSGL